MKEAAEPRSILRVAAVGHRACGPISKLLHVPFQNLAPVYRLPCLRNPRELLVRTTYSSLFASRQSAGVPFEQLCRHQRGDSDICQNVHQLPHKAARLLSHLGRHGCNVPFSSPPWTTAQTDDAAVERGSHKSAPQHLNFLEHESVEMMERAKPQESARESACGYPATKRRRRTIVDYTFSKVNSETLRLAPAEAI
jgi:hypothetical protein